MSRLRPPEDLASRAPRQVTLPAGASLHRFFDASFEPVHFDRSTRGRLNAPDAGYGVLYAARRPRGAFAETFLRQPGRRMIDPGLMAQRAYAVLQVSRPLNLIQLDGPGLAILGATAEVVHAGLPYDAPQAWSAALHLHPTQADGMAYTARHDPDEVCYAIFDRAADAIGVSRKSRQLDRDWFWRLADAYEMGRAPG